jgi:hypothetical protein
MWTLEKQCIEVVPCVEEKISNSLLERLKLPFKLPWDIFHSKVTEVHFIGVDNLLLTSFAASIFENPYRDKRLITELVWDKHIEYCHRESQGLSIERSSFVILRGVLFLMECDECQIVFIWTP